MDVAMLATLILLAVIMLVCMLAIGMGGFLLLVAWVNHVDRVERAARRRQRRA